MLGYGPARFSAGGVGLTLFSFNIASEAEGAGAYFDQWRAAGVLDLNAPYTASTFVPSAFL